MLVVFLIIKDNTWIPKDWNTFVIQPHWVIGSMINCTSCEARQGLCSVLIAMIKPHQSWLYFCFQNSNLHTYTSLRLCFAPSEYNWFDHFWGSRSWNTTKAFPHLLKANLSGGQAAEQTRRLHLIQVLPKGARGHPENKWWGFNPFGTAWSSLEMVPGVASGLQVRKKLRGHHFRHVTLLLFSLLQTVVLIQRDCRGKQVLLMLTLHFMIPLQNVEAKHTYKCECTSIEMIHSALPLLLHPWVG